MEHDTHGTMNNDVAVDNPVNDLVVVNSIVPTVHAEPEATAEVNIAKLKIWKIQYMISYQLVLLSLKVESEPARAEISAELVESAEVKSTVEVSSIKLT